MACCIGAALWLQSHALSKFVKLNDMESNKCLLERSSSSVCELPCKLQVQHAIALGSTWTANIMNDIAQLRDLDVSKARVSSQAVKLHYLQFHKSKSQCIQSSLFGHVLVVSMLNWGCGVSQGEARIHMYLELSQILWCLPCLVNWGVTTEILLDMLTDLVCLTAIHFC